MTRICTRMAAVAAGALLAVAGGTAAHAASGCTTLTDVVPNTSLMQCTFTADAESGSYHAEGTWNLYDEQTGQPVWLGGEASPLTQWLTPLPPQIRLTPGSRYRFVAAVPGPNLIVTGPGG